LVPEANVKVVPTIRFDHLSGPNELVPEGHEDGLGRLELVQRHYQIQIPQRAFRRLLVDGVPQSPAFEDDWYQPRLFEAGQDTVAFKIPQSGLPTETMPGGLPIQNDFGRQPLHEWRTEDCGNREPVDPVFHRETNEPRPTGRILKGGQVILEWPAHFVRCANFTSSRGRRNSAKLVIW
jgi:hypothetical protein